MLRVYTNKFLVRRFESVALMFEIIKENEK